MRITQSWNKLQLYGYTQTFNTPHTFFSETMQRCSSIPKLQRRQRVSLKIPIHCVEYHVMGYLLVSKHGRAILILSRYILSYAFGDTQTSVILSLYCTW